MVGQNSFTCPFCIRTYDKSSIEYVCPDDEQVVKKKVWMREPIKCSCGGLATKRRCPKCGEFIPKTALETPYFPFSIVGVSGSGKTNFITVMMHDLIYNNLDLAVGYQTVQTINHQNEMWERISQSYKPKVEPPQHTIPEEVFPQIWYIKNNQRGNKTDVPTYTFTIFDGAGETHEAIDANAIGLDDRELRYIAASRAIILTIDPLAFSSVIKGGFVDHDVLLFSRAGEIVESSASTVISGIADYIRSAIGIPAKKKLEIPIAVVLTKIDTVLSHPAFLGKSIQSSSLAVRNGKVNLTEMQEVDCAIREWLIDINESSFLSALNANFKEYMLFGVSSLGAPPTGLKTYPKTIRPHRILDPILWLFKREGFLS